VLETQGLRLAEVGLAIVVVAVMRDGAGLELLTGAEKVVRLGTRVGRKVNVGRGGAVNSGVGLEVITK
jgi:hypothetical protein